jgi:hypothetical protein
MHPEKVDGKAGLSTFHLFRFVRETAIFPKLTG